MTHRHRPILSLVFGLETSSQPIFADVCTIFREFREKLLDDCFVEDRLFGLRVK